MVRVTYLWQIDNHIKGDRYKKSEALQMCFYQDKWWLFDMIARVVACWELVPPPCLVSSRPTKVEKEVLVPHRGPRLNRAPVQAASIRGQTLRPGGGGLPRSWGPGVLYLRVPLSATMPSGRLPPILLHWICRPRPPSPSTSQTTCSSLRWSTSSSWWSTSSSWRPTSLSWWSSAFPSWWSTSSSWWSPPCGCRPDNHSRLAWSISLACLGSLSLLRRGCPSQVPRPSCFLSESKNLSSFVLVRFPDPLAGWSGSRNLNSFVQAHNLIILELIKS